MDEQDERWGLWIDIEGFSNLWSASDLALRGLNTLMALIHQIGTRCYPDDQDRLFAHQIGDGFYIASDFHEPSFDRCAAIAITLMRGVVRAGCVARATIAEGPLADYGGCRPREIQIQLTQTGESDVVGLGAGLMTLQAVMGQGIINAVTLDKVAQTKGAQLLIAATNRPRLSASFATRALAANPDIVAIDWLHCTDPLLEQIETRSGLPISSIPNLERQLRDYLAEQRLPNSWSDPTLLNLGL